METKSLCLPEIRLFLTRAGFFSGAYRSLKVFDWARDFEHCVIDGLDLLSVLFGVDRYYWGQKLNRVDRLSLYFFFLERDLCYSNQDDILDILFSGTICDFNS